MAFFSVLIYTTDMKGIFNVKNILSTICFFQTGIYLTLTAASILLLQNTNSVRMQAHAPPYDFLRYFPLIICIPVLYAFASLVFWHIALKIREQSPISWILAVLFFIAIPVPLNSVSRNILEQLTFLSQFSIFYLDIAHWSQLTGIVSILAFIALIMSVKKFNHEGQMLSRKSRMILGLFFLLVPLSVSVYALRVYWSSTNHDYGYSRISQKVQFPLYRPTYTPSNLVQETMYYIPVKGLFEKKTTVQVNYNLPLARQFEGNKGTIVLKQSQVPANFLLKDFFKKNKQTDTQEKTVSLKSISKGKAYLKYKKNALYLYFVSNRKTLIVINAFYIEEAALIRFAESLKT